MLYKNLHLIGTSHIAKQSVKEIKEAYKDGNPDIIALELDRQRLAALVSKKKPGFSFKSIFRVGIQGALFSLVGGYVQKKLGDYVGIKPGSDMLAGFKLAKKDKKMIALIDQDVTVTLRNISREFTWREKFRIVTDFFKGLILRQPQVESFDLRTVPEKELIKKLLAQVKEKYPSLYKVLISDRNKIMAKRLARLMKQYPDQKILAIVGAGHEEEMIELIKKYIKHIDVVYSTNFTVEM